MLSRLLQSPLKNLAIGCKIPSDVVQNHIKPGLKTIYRSKEFRKTDFLQNKNIYYVVLLTFLETYKQCCILYLDHLRISLPGFLHLHCFCIIHSFSVFVVG